MLLLCTFSRALSCLNSFYHQHLKPTRQQCSHWLTDTSSGLSPPPLAQIAVPAKVLCQHSNSSLDQSSCSIKNTQLAVLKQPDLLSPLLSPQTLYFEAMVTFNHYPWPEWTSALDAYPDVTINNGDSPPLVHYMLKARDREGKPYTCIWLATQCLPELSMC